MEPMEKREATVEKILIVDDDRAIGELVSDALADEGYETILYRTALPPRKRCGRTRM